MQLLIDLAANYGLFLAKTATLVIAALLIIGTAVSSIAAARAEKKSNLKVERINERLTQLADTLAGAMDSKADAKKRAKKRKAEAKKRAKQTQPDDVSRLFVLEFDGDIRASAVEPLRESINALLQVATEHDEVLLRLESGGGLVHSYGLAASQLDRLRQAGLTLTVSVDRVAASGGYMMACVGQRIVAAPFAIIGSIGVVAQLPNFHRWLDERHIDVELHTAGDHKRTLTMFGDNTDADREKFRQELDDTHGLFKNFVAEHRPGLDIDAVATGEHWYGRQAIDLQLVDEIATGDDLMLAAAKADRPVYALTHHRPGGLLSRLGGQASRALARLSYERGMAQARIDHH